MTPLLHDRLALVTGAGSGIGEGIAVAMAAAGARMLVADVNASNAQRVAAAIPRAVALALDVTDRAAVDAAAARIQSEFGPIAILVNNAGIIRRGTVDDPNTRADWDATMAVNLDGPYTVTTAFLEQLKATKGSVINIGSIQSFVALPNSAAYTTTKGGIRMLTKALSIELAPHGVRVNAIAPGLIATPLNERARQNPDYLANFGKRISLGRPGVPDDVAQPAVFLASEMARYITGVTLPVDGGFLAS